MDMTIAPGIGSFIESASSQQIWFTESTERAQTKWLQNPLNDGILNRFGAEGNLTCTNAALVFGYEVPWGSHDNGAAYNFWSCAFYPNFTRDYRGFRMTPENHTFVSTLDVDTSKETAADVTSFLSTCLVAYCKESAGCNSPSCTSERMAINGTTLLSAADVADCLTDICEHDPEKSTNLDIAGIGAITAYTIQRIVAFTSLLTVLILMAWGRSTDLPVRRIKKTLLVFLDEFQRTQCCFVIAVAIATLGTIDTMTHEDKRSVVTASGSALTPTLVVMALLMFTSERGHSSFTFWLTFCAWFFSFAVSLDPRTEWFPSTPSLKRFREQHDPCGGWPPSHICGYSKQKGLNWLSLVLLIPSMILITTMHFVLPSTRSEPLLGGNIRRVFIQEVCRPRKSYLAALIVWLLLVLGSVLVGTAYASLIWSGINAFSSWQDLTNKEWSFGQILAVTVWLPTMFSLINDCIYGPLADRTDQLPLRLRVFRSEASDAQTLDAPTLAVSLNGAQITPAGYPTAGTPSTWSSIERQGEESADVTHVAVQGKTGIDDAKAPSK